MNSDQDATPGGTVTLTIPIVKGQIFVVGSAVAYTQNMQLTNYSRFPPEIINKAMDRVVVQIQQIRAPGSNIVCSANVKQYARAVD